jgi:chromosome segregation ATPase
MAWFRRRGQAPSVRTPDPEPHIEARLRQIDTLQGQIADTNRQIARYQQEILLLQEESRRFARHSASALRDAAPNDDMREKCEKTIANYHALILQLRTDIQNMSARITTLQDEILEKRYKFLG